MTISRDQWEWFGVSGHHICGQWCRFHLCTLVVKYLVSSVGEYVHPRHSKGNERKESEWLKENWPGEDIGCDRKYETMVFIAGPRCVSKECMCGMPSLESPVIEIDSVGCNTRGQASKNHLSMCEKWSKQNNAPTQ